MARKHEAVSHLLGGMSPRQIAREMGVTLSTVMGYLYTQVGEGTIQRSDIVLSFSEPFRRAVEKAVREAGSAARTRVQYRLNKYGVPVDAEELYTYLQLRKKKVEFGDLYEWLRRIEIHLHSRIRTTLEHNHGKAWWRQLPVKVRQECSMTFEEHEEELPDRYCCTTFIHLRIAYEKLWPELSLSLPKALSKDKNRFLKELVFINNVRNAVMHPVKDLPVTEEAFRRIQHFSRLLTGDELVSKETWGAVLSMSPATKVIQ